MLGGFIGSTGRRRRSVVAADDVTAGDDVIATDDVIAGDDVTGAKIGGTALATYQAAIAAAAAATTAATASAIVKRRSDGYLQDRADPHESLFPAYQRTRAALGYTAWDFFTRCQEDGGAVNGLPTMTSPSYGVFAGDWRGIHLDQDGDAFGNTNVLDFGNNSVHMAVAFKRLIGGVSQSMIGRMDNGAALRYCMLNLGDTDTLKTQVHDGTRTIFQETAAGSVVANDVCLAQLHLRKDAGTVKVRLSKWGVGLVGAEFSADWSAGTTLGGGVAPIFGLGFTNNWGTGLVLLGAAVRIGADCNGAGKMAALASLTGFE